MTEFYTKIVGVTFEGRQRAISRLRPGDELCFVPEPDNSYDSHAVRVETVSGVILGYLSRNINT